MSNRARLLAAFHLPLCRNRDNHHGVLAGVYGNNSQYYYSYVTIPTEHDTSGLVNAGSEAAEALARQLMNAYPDVTCTLDYSTPFQLLIATMLSAQTTDERVNRITPALFGEFPTALDLAQARRDTVEQIVRPLGFQHRRSGQIIATAQALCTEFGGEVPQSNKELEKLPGVGHKTANVVMGVCFGARALTVDTHVGRLSRRLGWTRATSVTRVEKDVTTLLAGVNWTKLSHVLIAHGRSVCTAQGPRCDECPVVDRCPKVGVVPWSGGGQ